MGRSVDGLVGRGGEGGHFGRPGGHFGTQKGSFLSPGGAWGVTLGTPGATLGTQGVTFEPQGSHKWIDLMSVKLVGTILESPGGIWGVIWSHVGTIVEVIFDTFSCRFVGCVFGRFGRRFWSHNCPTIDQFGAKGALRK